MRNRYLFLTLISYTGFTVEVASLLFELNKNFRRLVIDPVTTSVKRGVDENIEEPIDFRKMVRKITVPKRLINVYITETYLKRDRERNETFLFSKHSLEKSLIRLLFDDQVDLQWYKDLLKYVPKANVHEIVVTQRTILYQFD